VKMLTTNDISLNDFKIKLEEHILMTEKHLIELRLITENKIEIEMGKIRMLGLEVVSSLASVRNYFILHLRNILPRVQINVLENIAAKSIEWQLEMNQDGKKDFIKWKDLDRNWLDIVSSIDNVIQHYQKDIDMQGINTVLKELAMLESHISLHLEFLLSGNSRFGDQNKLIALRHIQEYEDRLNKAQENRVYQRHIRKSKSFKIVKSEGHEKVNQKAKYQRSKTTEIANIANIAQTKDVELKKSKSDSLVKSDSQKLEGRKSHDTRQRKSSFMDQVTHILKHVL